MALAAASVSGDSRATTKNFSGERGLADRSLGKVDESRWSGNVYQWRQPGESFNGDHFPEYHKNACYSFYFINSLPCIHIVIIFIAFYLLFVLLRNSPSGPLKFMFGVVPVDEFFSSIIYVYIAMRSMRDCRKIIYLGFGLLLWTFVERCVCQSAMFVRQTGLFGSQVFNTWWKSRGFIAFWSVHWRRLCTTPFEIENPYCSLTNWFCCRFHCLQVEMFGIEGTRRICGGAATYKSMSIIRSGQFNLW